MSAGSDPRSSQYDIVQVNKGKGKYARDEPHRGGEYGMIKEDVHESKPAKGKVNARAPKGRGQHQDEEAEEDFDVQVINNGNAKPEPVPTP